MQSLSHPSLPSFNPVILNGDVMSLVRPDPLRGDSRREISRGEERSTRLCLAALPAPCKEVSIGINQVFLKHNVQEVWRAAWSPTRLRATDPASLLEQSCKLPGTAMVPYSLLTLHRWGLSFIGATLIQIKYFQCQGCI